MGVCGRRFVIGTLLTLCLTTIAGAQALPAAAPESAGMSSERLARLTSVMDAYTRDKQIAGTLTLVVRGGRVVYFEPSGFLDLEKGVRMPKDAIFRIASMSKAITTVGAMMLVEEGRMLLTDPVGKYVPSLASTTVRGSGASTAINPVGARRPITIRDLMTHTAGVSYGGGELEDLYTNAGFTQWYFADRQEPIGYWIDKLATLPFESHPGERYVYGYSTDILGYVIEKASAMPLDRYLATRVLGPLKMVDTSFFLAPEKASRLATVYGKRPNGIVTRAPDGHPVRARTCAARAQPSRAAPDCSRPQPITRASCR